MNENPSIMTDCFAQTSSLTNSIGVVAFDDVPYFYNGTLGLDGIEHRMLSVLSEKLQLSLAYHMHNSTQSLAESIGYSF